MTRSRMLLALAGLALLLLALTGCQSRRYTYDVSLAGQTVAADTLNHGYDVYMRNCYACHGDQGDGRGPSAPGLRPPPRDFRTATYKFGWVVDGLPHDEDLKRIVSGGLHGTPMLEWDLPDDDFDAVIQYLKLFAYEEAWSDPDGLGEQVNPTRDPWAGREKEAIARGEAVYHGFATCQSCHPAYVREAEVASYAREWSKPPTFRTNGHFSELKDTEYQVEGQTIRVMPPDFTFNPMRVSHDLEDVYRTLGAGISGTAMPAWKGSLPEEDLWALSYYTKSLIDMRDTGKAVALRERLLGSSGRASGL